ncbi:tricarballylate utilization 4Fe-4S protein TcuB [Sphaerotilus microaerophilus]|uniref:Citrate utilization protein B n=1 Tax=Sphaerotilus microaerophilus TaxID=2914710 RepID=A0ABM7YLK7_9BURK|nr:tricarballylate utilization 4Fe-4S protein TcuB [Sphaerotilus sp. FB-5]BDI05319.1 citrate utilization protein B [Sphaerotilus sp. FB-5]
MRSLDPLIEEARALADGQPVSSPSAHSAEGEVARVLQICNACRYCEGFCAVFPAMTRRLEFHRADVHYLANLCHNCGACLHACQYAPPHEFQVNVPRAMAEVRGRTYAEYAWPAPLGRLYQRNGLTLSVALAAALALFLILAVALRGSLAGTPAGSFYDIFPHHLLVGLFAPVFGFAALALAMGLRRFWRDVTPVTSGQPVSAPASAEAAGHVLTLTYLDGGHGEGCHNEDDAWTLARRRLHHLTFYGFLLCFAATGVGTLAHYLLGWAAPYPLASLPKLLGVAGGVSLLIGTTGLGWLNLRRHPLHGAPAQRPMDRGFIALLFLTSASGLALWLAAGSAALPLWLCLHLGCVMALFATLPYGKFAHGIYRTAALLRHAVEKRQPNPVGLGAD